MALPTPTPGQCTEVPGTTLRPVVGGPPLGVAPPTRLELHRFLLYAMPPHAAREGR